MKSVFVITIAVMFGIGIISPINGQVSCNDFVIIIDIADEGDLNYSLIADYNEYDNAKNIEAFLGTSSLYVNETLDCIKSQLSSPKGEAYESLRTIQDTNRWNSDGSETYEYITVWTEYRAYNDVGGFIDQLQELMNGGMSLEAALDWEFRHMGVPQGYGEPRPEPVDPVDELRNEIEELNNKISQLTSEINALVRQNESLEKENESLEKRLDEILQKQFEEEQKSMRKEIASFVDVDKDPQFYVDRYNNEEKYREWFHDNFPDYKSIHEAVGKREPIPDWIKNSAQWWSEGMISEDEFIKGIEYLVENRILKVN